MARMTRIASMLIDTTTAGSSAEDYERAGG